jgi:hypothetical protein
MVRPPVGRVMLGGILEGILEGKLALVDFFNQLVGRRIKIRAGQAMFRPTRFKFGR